MAGDTCVACRCDAVVVEILRGGACSSWQNTHTIYSAVPGSIACCDDKDVCRLDFDESLDLDIKSIFNHFFFQQFWVLSLRLIVIKQVM